MKILKGIKHEKEFDTMTLFTDTKESLDRKTLADTRLDLSEGQPTQVYEPRPLTPEDDIYEDIIEQFATAPTKPKYWFEEFGDYWSCSCGHINKGDSCKSCGLERELLRSLFILHKPADEAGKLDKKLKENKEQADKESQLHTDKENRRKAREASGEDLTKVIPIEEDKQLVVIPSPQKKPFLTKRKFAIAIAACVVLIGICGFAIYKHMAAPAMQYDEAQQLQAEGQYEKAIEKYTALGDYKDAKDLIHQCWVLWGDEYYNNSKFKKAITAYETAMDLKKDKSLNEKIRLCYIGMGDKYLANNEFEKALGAYAVAADIAAGEDVQQKINDAKFGYIKAFQSERTAQVEEYLKELKDMNYPGINEVYDTYYAWHVSIVANKSESDYSTDQSTFSRKDTVYFHVSLSGGEPNEKVALYYEVKWPDGRNEIFNLESSWKAGDRLVSRFQYSMPMFGREGKLIFTVYEKNTNKALGSDTINFKN